MNANPIGAINQRIQNTPVDPAGWTDFGGLGGLNPKPLIEISGFDRTNGGQPLTSGLIGGGGGDFRSPFDPARYWEEWN